MNDIFVLVDITGLVFGFSLYIKNMNGIVVNFFSISEGVSSLVKNFPVPSGEQNHGASLASSLSID